jgi:adenosylcobyric acid synthase
VLLVANIDRGGAFAALLGTWDWLSPDERALVRGFILNKFRGDATLLAPAPALLEERTGVAVIGVVPYLDNLVLPEEDAASLQHRAAPDACLEIAVVQLPHVTNFDEFEALAAEPDVALRYITRPQELRAPDLVILPGSKATIPDLFWLHERGLADRIRWLAGQRTPVLGVCGGYQMLGRVVCDPQRLESEHASAAGLGLLPVETELGGTKRLVRTCGLGVASTSGVWSALRGVDVDGYEIHMGTTRGDTPQPFLNLVSGPDGCVSADGSVAGTYLHGIFEQAEPRHAVLEALAQDRGFSRSPARNHTADPYDELAGVLSVTLDLRTSVARSG